MRRNKYGRGRKQYGKKRRSKSRRSKYVKTNTSRGGIRL
jgi:hypothetical protein